MAEEKSGGLDRRWTLVAVHRDRLLRVVAGRTASTADAEDVVHEAMVRCVLFDDLDEERVGQFLTSVAIRLCADGHRRNGSADRLVERLTAHAVDEESPEERICDAAEARAVAAVYETLPERQRSVVAARSEGMSCGQVAHRLGLTYGAVESALVRARTAVRARVEICLDATALLACRAARTLRTVPAELPGASAVVIAGLVSTLAAGSLAVAAPATSPPATVAMTVAAPTPLVRLSSTPVAAAPSPAPAPPEARPTGRPRSPSPSPSPALPTATPYIYDEDPPYTTEEWIHYCIEYGIEYDVESRDTIRCRTPYDQPSPTPRSIP